MLLIADDIDDAWKAMKDAVGFFRVTRYKEAFIRMF